MLHTLSFLHDFPGPRPGIDGAGGRPAAHKNMGRKKGYSIL